jgi:hypothetical protein
MRPLLLSLFLVCCGAFAGWQVASLLTPQPRADEIDVWFDDYRLERRGSDGFAVSDGKWLRVPRLFPDFDLYMDVELGPSMDLDLLVRQVEPRLLQGRLRPFAERFSALRLSTAGAGPAWRTREDVLFGSRGAGADVAPGLLATVWVQGRGALLRANVAGKQLPWFQADDAYGGFTLVARGGTAVLQRLVIENRGVPASWRWSAAFWILMGALGGGFVALGALARGAPWHFALAGVWLAGYLAWWVGSGVDPAPLRWPPPGALAMLLGANCLFAAFAVWAAGSRRVLAALAGVAIAAVAQQFAMDEVRGQLQLDDRAVEAVFGPAAGNGLAEAHAQIVRGPFGLHTPGAPEPRVMLLGGQLLYGRLGAPDEHIEPLLTGILRRELKKPVAVASLPTIDGHAAQQWQLFTRFFAAGHDPNALVFGVPAGEDEPDPTNGEPRSSAAAVERTLQQARAHAREHGCALVIFTEAGLRADILAVLQAAAADGVPLIIAGDGEGGAPLAQKLAAAILPALR